MGMAASPDEQRFGMTFDDRFRVPLAALGITPATAYVTVAPQNLVARLGPWVCRTTPSNVTNVQVSGPYHWYRVIGARLSFADRGLTFGTGLERGVCLRFARPVRGLDPLGLLRHPGLTVTVQEPDRFAATVRRFAGLG
ncbi:MAG TPA: hypothetical protein VLR26_17115 [Frankiaceae bacterium]|nr:hypothetical protein [Frankiaceae bacterium]